MIGSLIAAAAWVALGAVLYVEHRAQRRHGDLADYERNRAARAALGRAVARTDRGAGSAD